MDLSQRLVRLRGGDFNTQTTGFGTQYLFGTYNPAPGIYTVRVCLTSDCSPTTTTANITLVQSVSIPSALTGVSAALSNDNKNVILTWPGVLNDITEFHIYRRLQGEASWPSVYDSRYLGFITNNSNGTLSVSVGVPSMGNIYEYKILACNSAGCSGDSNIATLNVPVVTWSLEFSHSQLTPYSGTQITKGTVNATVLALDIRNLNNASTSIRSIRLACQGCTGAQYPPEFSAVRMYDNAYQTQIGHDVIPTSATLPIFDFSFAPSEFIIPANFARTVLINVDTVPNGYNLTHDFSIEVRSAEAVSSDTGTALAISGLPVYGPTLSLAQSTTKFMMNDRVYVNTGNLKVRSTPTGKILGSHKQGNRGTVIGGPAYAGGYTWWQINYDTAPDGWSVESYLSKVVVAETSIQTNPFVSPPSFYTATPLNALTDEQRQMFIINIQQTIERLKEKIRAMQ